MSSLLQQGRAAKDYCRLVAYLKGLTPSRVDSELRAMQARPPYSQLGMPCERFSKAWSLSRSADTCCGATFLACDSCMIILPQPCLDP